MLLFTSALLSVSASAETRLKELIKGKPKSMSDRLLLLKPERQKSSLAQLMLTQQSDVHCCVLPPLACWEGQ